jgi:poly(A) polymerase
MKDIIREIAKYFDSNGYKLYAVGGCVRDEIMGNVANDIDLTTDAKPLMASSLLGKFGHIYNVGQEYGTIGVSIDGVKIEVTTFRKEVYVANSRKPNVTFGTDLLEDLRRRDFTINAIAMDCLTNKVIDPFGGVHDIRIGAIRCVESDDRFDEDPLRMMRAVRFVCKFGFDLEAEMKHPERLKIVSKERVKDELSKILLSNDPEQGIRFLVDRGLMSYIIPEFLDLKYLPGGKNHMKDAYEHTLAVVKRSTAFDFGDDNLVFRLSCMLHDIAKPRTFSVIGGEIHFYDHHMVGGDMAEHILRDLKFDSVTIERSVNLIRRHMEPIMLTISDTLTKRGVSRLIRRVSSDSYNDIEMLLALVSCDLSSSANPRHKLVAELRHLVNEVQAILPKQKAPLDGNEIMEATDIGPSKIVGEIKEFLCDQVVDGVVAADDKETLKAMAKEYYDKHNF